MKVHVIGGCGSGKTYIASKLAELHGIPHYQTDNMVWNRQSGERNPELVRDELLRQTVERPEWVIEGVHHKWVDSSFEAADYIFVLRPPLYVRNIRTVSRFFRTRLGMEAANYKQDLRNLFVMLGWNRDFENKHLASILEKTTRYMDKRVILHRNTDVLAHFPL